MIFTLNVEKDVYLSRIHSSKMLTVYVTVSYVNVL